MSKENKILNTKLNNTAEQLKNKFEIDIKSVNIDINDNESE